MPSLNSSALENPTTARIITAVAAGATTYIRPGRFPKWVRRSVSMSNTLTGVGASMLASRPAKNRVATDPGKDVVEVVDGKPVSRANVNLVSAVTAGMALASSGIALRADRRVEKFLLKRGVRHPRLWMAVGSAALSLSSPWITKVAQTQGAKLQERFMPKEKISSTLADPLKKNTSGSAQTSLNSGGTQSTPENTHEAGQGTPSSETPSAAVQKTTANNSGVVAGEGQSNHGDDQPKA